MFYYVPYKCNFIMEKVLISPKSLGFCGRFPANEEEEDEQLFDDEYYNQLEAAKGKY